MKTKIIILTLVIVSAILMINGCASKSSQSSKAEKVDTNKEDYMRIAHIVLNYMRITENINEEPNSFAFHIVAGVNKGNYTF